MSDLGITDLVGYRALLETDPAEWGAIDECCHITISRFFRDMHVFEVLRRHVLPDTAARALSGAGWAIGYVDGILSLVLVLGFLAASPNTGRTLLGFMPLFGLDPVTHEGDRITGPLSGIWFVVFVLPMFLLMPDYPANRLVCDALREGLTDLRHTLAKMPMRKSMVAFLLANMIYTDGRVSLFAFGGIYAAGTFGWNTTQIGSFGVILAIAGAFGAWLGERSTINSD